MSDRRPPILMVVPCLNEARQIGRLLGGLCAATHSLDAMIIVADGGSTDGTRNIVTRIADQDWRVVLIENPKRLQSAAVNLAVQMFGETFEYVIRIDVHGAYPADYCSRLVEDALNTGADSVVVSMRTNGSGIIQSATAAAQNSRLGTGGSKHRLASEGQWIEHGHHALMRISAFTAVGGYDETFSHNEDAELDYRLANAGYRIWMTGKTRMTYYPRSSFGALFLQYLRYGRGRARNMLKHRNFPNFRQILPLMVFPTTVLILLSYVNLVALMPLFLWTAICICYGIKIALHEARPSLILAGVSAMIMHFAWSTGFWLQLASSAGGQRGIT